MRTFISLNPDRNTLDRILKIQNNLKKSVSDLNEKYSDLIKWESKDKFHVTLFFLGETNESQLNKIDSEMSKLNSDLNQGPVRFCLGGINAFPKLRYPRVLILDLLNEDKKVFTLYEKLEQSLKSTGIYTDKKFHPHITLGRIKRDHKINLSELKISTDHNFSFSVNEFCLMESRLKSFGSEYSELKKYKL